MEAYLANKRMEVPSAEYISGFAESNKSCIITISGEKGLMSVDMYKILGRCGCDTGRV